MNSYAIIEAGGKQFWVEEGRFYDFDKLPLNAGDSLKLQKVLLVQNTSGLFIGKPFLSDYSIEATVLRHILGPKTLVYKMRPKKKTRKTFGNRVKLTRVHIKKIDSNPVSAVKCYF